MKKLLFVAILSLTLTCVGCGSSGNSNPITSPSPSSSPNSSPITSPPPSSSPNSSPITSPPPSAIPYSSDYCGWEPGFELTHQVTKMDQETNNGAVTNYTISSNTNVREDGILKIVYDIYPEGGSLVLKEGNKYYAYGDWYSDRKDELYSPPNLIVSAPITNSFVSAQWGKVTGQSPVVVPYGTFTAWLFEYTDEIQYTGYSHKCKKYTWFVPYIGIVKIEETDWENGVMTKNFKAELISCTKGVTVRNSSSKSVRSQNTSSHPLNLFGKHVR